MRRRNKELDDLVGDLEEEEETSSNNQLSGEGSGLSAAGKELGISIELPTNEGEEGNLPSNMVKEDVDRWTRWKNGEHFPWDAPNYHSEAIILSGKPGTRRNVS